MVKAFAWSPPARIAAISLGCQAGSNLASLGDSRSSVAALLQWPEHLDVEVSLAVVVALPGQSSARLVR